MSTALIPPFTHESALRKVRLAEDAWNSRDPDRIAQAYTPDSRWRNRAEFITGRDAIRTFLQGKWEREFSYRLVKELWACGDRRIAVRFQYEYHDAAGAWHRAYGNENWEFDESGLMAWRQASINDVRITEAQRLFAWEAPGPRPPEHPGLADHEWEVEDEIRREKSTPSVQTQAE